MLSVASMYAQAKDQDMSGLQIGGGINVTFDKDEFNDVNVANQVKQVSATAAQVVTGQNVDDLVTKLWAYNKSGQATESISVNGTDVITTNSVIEVEPSAYYYKTSKHAKLNTINVGAEIKLAYFYQFNCGLMMGIDAACVFASKKNNSVIPGKMPEYPDLNLMINDDSPVKFTHNGTGYTGDDVSINIDDTITIQPNTKIDDSLNYTVTDSSSPEEELYSCISFDEKHDKYGDITVANRGCSPRCAAVLGYAHEGTFAGIRGGISYEKLNIAINGHYYEEDGETYALQHQTWNKTVSLTSPFLGLQVIKQVETGINDAQFYFTADWQLKTGERDIDTYGVKKIKRKRYNLSAGVTWKVKILN